MDAVRIEALPNSAHSLAKPSRQPQAAAGGTLRVPASASGQPSGQGPARNGSGVRNLGQSSKSGGAWSKPLPRGGSFDQSARFPGFILRAKYKSPGQRGAGITKQNAGRLSAPLRPENLPSERTFDQKAPISRIWLPSEASIDHFKG